LHDILLVKDRKIERRKAMISMMIRWQWLLAWEQGDDYLELAIKEN